MYFNELQPNYAQFWRLSQEIKAALIECLSSPVAPSELMGNDLASRVYDVLNAQGLNPRFDLFNRMHCSNGLIVAIHPEVVARGSAASEAMENLHDIREGDSKILYICTVSNFLDDEPFPGSDLLLQVFYPNISLLLVDVDVVPICEVIGRND